ncbi:MAG: oligosaccharide flippase family protein [Bacteroidetes bacterium]|nr:oligosaccharide flippase family protein [Bacteroidota bacterium]
MNRVKQFFSQTAFFTVIQILPPLAGFVMIKLYSNYLTEAEFSIYNLINLYTNLIFIFISFGADQLITRFYYEYQEDINKLKEFYGTIFSCFLILTGIFLLLLFPFNADINRQLFKNTIPDYQILLAIVTLNALNLSFTRVIQSILRVERNNKENFIFSILIFFFQIIGSSIGLFAFNNKILGTFIGRFAGIAIIIFLIYIRSKNSFQLSFKLKYIYKQWFFFLPIVFYNGLYWLSTFSDQFVFNILTSRTNQLALYQMAFNLTIVVDMLLTAVNAHITPEFNELMKNKPKDYMESIRTNAHLLIVISITGMIGIIFLAQIIIDFVIDIKYRTSSIYLGAISVMYIFRLLYLIFAIPLYYLKKTIYLPGVFFVSTIINILLNIFLIPIFGIWSLIISSALSKIIQTTFISVISLKHFPIQYNWAKIIILPVVFFLLMVGATLVQLWNPINFYLLWLIPSVVISILMYFSYKKQIIHLFSAIRIKLASNDS